jgi:hypothetical protein
MKWTDLMEILQFLNRVQECQHSFNAQEGSKIGKLITIHEPLVKLHIIAITIFFHKLRVRNAFQR